MLFFKIFNCANLSSICHQIILTNFIFFILLFQLQCMDAFGKQKLMNLSQVEQTISTGVDEDGKDVKGQKLLTLVLETLKGTSDENQKKRLMSIFIASQRDATAEDKRILMKVKKALNNLLYKGSALVEISYKICYQC